MSLFSLLSEPNPVEEEEGPSSCPTAAVSQSEGLNPGDNNLVEVKPKVGRWLCLLLCQCFKGAGQW